MSSDELVRVSETVYADTVCRLRQIYEAGVETADVLPILTAEVKVPRVSAADEISVVEASATGTVASFSFFQQARSPTSTSTTRPVPLSTAAAVASMAPSTLERKPWEGTSMDRWHVAMPRHNLSIGLDASLADVERVQGPARARRRAQPV